MPMIVNGPGLVKPLGLREELIDLSDVFPTLVDFAGTTLPDDRPIDGRSFAPLLRGEKYQSREWIYACLAGRRVVRTPRWLLENNSPRNFGQLYDCGESRDGASYRDVTASTEPEVLAAKRHMEEILTDKPVPDVPKSPAKKKAKNRSQRKPAKIAN